MPENLVTVIAIATAIGSALGFVVSSLIQVFHSKAERKQKRIELHVKYLQEQLIRIDERLDQIINANNVSVGLALGEEAVNAEDIHSRVRNQALFNFANLQNIHELNHLKALISSHKIDDDNFKFQISEIQIRSQALRNNVSEGVKVVHLTEAISILMDIQIKYRIVLNILIEQLLND